MRWFSWGWWRRSWLDRSGDPPVTAREIASFGKGYADGWANHERVFGEKAEAANIERDRLALLLSRYDKCVCGMLRHEHGRGGPAMLAWRCNSFRLDDPADPLETASASHDGSGVLLYETLTVLREQEREKNLARQKEAAEAEDEEADPPPESIEMTFSQAVDPDIVPPGLTLRAMAKQAKADEKPLTLPPAEGDGQAETRE